MTEPFKPTCMTIGWARRRGADKTDSDNKKTPAWQAFFYVLIYGLRHIVPKLR